MHPGHGPGKRSVVGCEAAWGAGRASPPALLPLPAAVARTQSGQIAAAPALARLLVSAPNSAARPPFEGLCN